ncbi:MAG TPA: 2-dehydropantoate 2-reductase [Permianibacter sp.]|nr:2-dehydropantoate 2-reductase [Permianibacter sp.]
MKQASKGNWHVLGAGAQGLLWAGALTEAGQPVCLLDKPGRDPLHTLTYQAGKTTRRTVEVTSQALPLPADAQRLLVTVKATDVDSALRALGPHADALELVVLLQNGIGAETIARTCLPADTVIWLGTSTHGSFRTARNAVTHAGVGGIWLGPGRGQLPTERHQAALTSLQQTWLNVQWDEQIQSRLWHKLAINSCINPLTALLNCRNGELLQHPVAAQWLPALASEAAAVLTAIGHGLSSAELLQRVRAIAEQTASNYNSMQQDYLHQRPTEIDFITGSLLRAAAIHQLQLPHHAELLTRVQHRHAFGV